MALQARDRMIEAFTNDPTVTVFLMSLKAGGVALNLTAASHVMLMDPWWNPSVEFQVRLFFGEISLRRWGYPEGTCALGSAGAVLCSRSRQHVEEPQRRVPGDLRSLSLVLSLGKEMAIQEIPEPHGCLACHAQICRDKDSYYKADSMCSQHAGTVAWRPRRAALQFTGFGVKLQGFTGQTACGGTPA